MISRLAGHQCSEVKLNSYPPPPKDKQLGIKINIPWLVAKIKKWLKRKDRRRQ